MPRVLFELAAVDATPLFFFDDSFKRETIDDDDDELFMFDDLDFFKLLRYLNSCAKYSRSPSFFLLIIIKFDLGRFELYIKLKSTFDQTKLNLKLNLKNYDKVNRATTNPPTNAIKHSRSFLKLNQTKINVNLLKFEN